MSRSLSLIDFHVLFRGEIWRSNKRPLTSRFILRDPPPAARSRVSKSAPPGFVGDGLLPSAAPSVPAETAIMCGIIFWRSGFLLKAVQRSLGFLFFLLRRAPVDIPVFISARLNSSALTR